MAARPPIAAANEIPKKLEFQKKFILNSKKCRKKIGIPKKIDMKFQIVGMLAVNIVAASSDGRRPRPRLFYGRGQAAATIVTATIPSFRSEAISGDVSAFPKTLHADFTYIFRQA